MPQSRIERSYAGMYFSTNTNDHCRRAAYRELIFALKGYLDGKEKRYAVTDALEETTIIFHETGQQAASIIINAMNDENEENRKPQFLKALALLKHHL